MLLEARSVSKAFDGFMAVRGVDLDVASEMTRLTSQQILVQAGVSVLAQANQASGSVLALLR